ncbi:MAG TPA: response regulator [Gemmatimonadaceae bacterium]|nr:response regulator [Gemmatimonadaceae bacterium]
MTRRTPPNGQVTEALRVLRERYRETSANTVAAFRRLAAQLAASPDAPEVIEVLRRELHRVHGSAGSYGFPEASRLAGMFEERAIQWAADPALERERRAAMTEHFAGALEARLGGVSAMNASQAPASGSSANAPAAARPAAPARPHPATTPAADGRELRRPDRDAVAGEGSHGSAGDVPDLIVVEDDPALADMLSYALGAAGFSFRHFATGPEALDVMLSLDTGRRRPIVLLDVDLPGLDGFSLHERLRVERPDAYAIVFLTARGGEAEQLRAYRAGAMDYLAKPINLRILMAKIPSWLDRARHGG